MFHVSMNLFPSHGERSSNQNIPRRLEYPWGNSVTNYFTFFKTFVTSLIVLKYLLRVLSTFIQDKTTLVKVMRYHNITTYATS